MDKKPKISFIMPCFNDSKTIERAVDSIIDQDVKDLEVIIVDDGSTDNSKLVIKNLEQKYDNVKAIYFDKNKGACIARNEGAKIAKGEFFAWLPADALIYPGMVRVWLNAFEDNPDCDFVYGGYRFTDDNYNHVPGAEYYFQPFDAHMLEVSNYIDGSFPIRADKYWEYAKKMNQPDGLWDPNVKSLQDWDFWLSVVRNGGKGAYIYDIMFETTLPHAGGLSYDSNANWVERTNFIKKKHGIPDRRICVNSIGARFHGINTAKLLDADFKEMPSFKPHTYDAIYTIGFYPELAKQQDSAYLNVLGNPQAGRTPAKKVVHFVGSDVYQLYNVSMNNLKFYRDYFKNAIDEILCESDFIKEELDELGITGAKIVPLPPKDIYDVMDLPEKFTVAVYDPAVNQSFYRPDEMLRITKMCPDIEFKFFGHPAKKGRRKLKVVIEKGKKGEVFDYEEGKDTNIEDMGYVENMGEFIKQCSAIMRFPLHDGLPLSVLEFLTAGRYSIQSVPIKHTTHIKDFSVEKVVEELNKLSKVTKPNIEGSKYWRKELDHKKYIKKIKEICGYDPKKYWDKRADSWDKQATDSPWDADEVKKIIDKIPEKITSVIDMGCGNGKWYPLLSTLGKYEGFDIAKKLVDISKKKYKDGKFFVDTVETFKGKYDLAFSYTTLEHITEDNFQKAVDNIKKNCKYLLLVEPTDFNSRFYCHNHDYKKYFNVIEEKKLTDKTIMLCKM